MRRAKNCTVVVGVTDEEVEVDFNHPLAGADTATRSTHDHRGLTKAQRIRDVKSTLDEK